MGRRTVFRPNCHEVVATIGSMKRSKTMTMTTMSSMSMNLSSKVRRDAVTELMVIMAKLETQE